MKKLTLTIAFPTAALFGSVASPALANPVSCSYGDLSRQIEVVYSDPGQAVPCEVIYNKQSEGTQQSLWRANNEAGYCEARAAEFIEKLEGWGWNCEADSGDAE